MNRQRQNPAARSRPNNSYAPDDHRPGRTLEPAMTTALSLSLAHYGRAEHVAPNGAVARPLPKAQNDGLDVPEGLSDPAPNRHRSAAAPGDDRALEIVSSECLSTRFPRAMIRPVWNPSRTRSYLLDRSGSPLPGYPVPSRLRLATAQSVSLLLRAGARLRPLPRPITSAAQADPIRPETPAGLVTHYRGLRT